MAIKRKVFRITHDPTLPKREEKRIDKNPKNNSLSKRPHLYVSESASDLSDAYVYLCGRDFREIFGTRHGDSLKYSRTIPVVKISRGKKRIYRQFRCLNIQGFSQYAGLSYTSLLGISYSNEDMKNINTVELSPGNILSYYSNHPFHATRVSFQIGIISIIISFLSCALSLIL
ncbi:MAG: hypothetical protein IJT90_00665 [Bacteroidaceae bacterium]|nr:hypothetical protein [Bacteroidaceae bacterium]